MSPPNRPRRRAYKPKTRTGCHTCKVRRVKCDEGKPFCARCVKFGADCEGYEVGSRQNASTTNNLKKLLPRGNHYEAFVLLPIGESPTAAVFHDHRDYAYFRYFQDEVMFDIAGSFDRSLWNHVILQASRNELSLCRFVASIGALCKAGGLKANNLSREEKDSHQQYAFRQYGRALKSVQATISTKPNQDTPRIALIASLLIYCFENLNGELDLALGHLKGALQLMHKQLTHASRRYKHSENRSPISSLDDDLVAAFFRLDSGLLFALFRDEINNPEPFGSRLGMHHLETVLEIPERFYTISEARNFLEHIQFPNVPRLTQDLLYQINMPHLPTYIDENAREMYTLMYSQMHRWYVAFAPLYAETLTRHDEEMFLAAATLRVRAVSIDLASQRACGTGLSPQSFNSKSREIVDLSNVVAADPNFLKSFVWDCGIVPGLTIVIATCLDMSIRQDALHLLRQIVPRREGAWDSLTSVKLGEIWLQIS